MFPQGASFSRLSRLPTLTSMRKVEPLPDFIELVASRSQSCASDSKSDDETPWACAEPQKTNAQITKNAAARPLGAFVWHKKLNIENLRRVPRGQALRNGRPGLQAH
jgi:hypothetical protein